MLFSKTAFAAIAALIESREENDPCRYYCDIFRFTKNINIDDYFWEKYLLPNVYIWDPLSQIEGLTLKCPLCIEDGRTNAYLKVTSMWEKGNKTASIPRRVWDYSWFCALVGRTYRCSVHHDVRSYHAGVLKQLKSEQVPFVLSHESGMMVSYLDNALRLMEEKSNYYQIRCITSKLFCDTYMHRKALCSHPDFPNIHDVYKTTCPSEYLIKLGVMNYFKMNFWKYAQHFTDIPCKSLICDFAFHEKATIGYVKDRKWISTQDSLFIASNEQGKVKAFKLTLGTEFDQVIKMLTSISLVSEDIEIVCIDNCCGLREILSGIFPNAAIKLHPAHALKRLLNCVPTNHPSYDSFAKDLQRIFRARNDYFLNRHQPTPSSAAIMDLFNKFLEKWNNFTDESWCIITPAFALEIENVKMHIANGCLSDIPPDSYEDKIRSLTDHISSTLLNNKYPFGDAQAILTNIIYSLNSKNKETQHPKTKDYNSLLPIWSVNFPCINKSVMLIENGNEATANGANESTDEIMEACVTLQQLKHPVKHQYENEIQITDCAMRKILCLANAYNFLDTFCSDNELFFKENKSYEGLETIVSPGMSLTEYFKNCKENDPMSVKELSKIFVKEGYGIAETKEHGFILCLELLLRDIATKDLPEEYTKKIEAILESDNITDKIVEVLTEELNGDRKQEYIDIYTEHYYGNSANENTMATIEKSFELHDIFPFIASNAFHISILIIPLCMNAPSYPVFPENFIIEDVSFILYDPADDLFLPLIKIPNFTPAIKSMVQNKANLKCSCGANDKINKVRCLHGRCPCRKGSAKCDSRCRCKGCHNGKVVKAQTPTGEDQTPTDEATEKPVRSYKRRKRQAHSLSFKTFDSLDQHGMVNTTHLSKLKEIILQVILYVDVSAIICKLEDIDLSQINVIFNVYCKKLLQKLQSIEYDNQDILDALLTLEKSEVEKWITDGKNLSIVQTFDEDELAEANNALEKLSQVSAEQSIIEEVVTSDHVTLTALIELQQ